MNNKAQRILENVRQIFAVTLGWIAWLLILVWIGAITITAEQHGISLFGPLLLTTVILGGILGGILFVGLAYYAFPKTKRKFPFITASIWATLAMIVGINNMVIDNSSGPDYFTYGASTIITLLIFYVLNRYHTARS